MPTSLAFLIVLLVSTVNSLDLNDISELKFRFDQFQKKNSLKSILLLSNLNSKFLKDAVGLLNIIPNFASNKKRLNNLYLGSLWFYQKYCQLMNTWKMFLYMLAV